MSQKLFLNTGRETIKGGALHALKDSGNAGAYVHSVLSLTGVVADGETFSLGDDTYELALVTTDSGQNTANGDFNNTSDFINVGITGASVGDVFRVESEFFVVISAGAQSAVVKRGFGGSAVVAHADALDIFTTAAAVPATAGNLVVPVSAAAAATADDQIVAAVNFWSAGYRKGLGGGIGVDVENALKVEAVLVAASTIAFGYPADGQDAATSETLTNGTLSAFINGVEPAGQRYSRFSFVSAGTGAENFFAPFEVTSAVVTAFDADGSLVNAATVVVTATVLANRVVQIAGAGKAAGQVLIVEMFE